MACALLVVAGCASGPEARTPLPPPPGAHGTGSEPPASRTVPEGKRAQPRNRSPRCQAYCGNIARYAEDAGHGELGPLLCELAICESGLGCTGKIHSRNGRYHGAFQFSAATWRSQCGPIFGRLGLEECRPRQRMTDLRCSTACSAEIIARRGLGDWPACGRRIAD